MEYNKKELIAYCDELVNNGDELKITWNGGNDEGFIYVKLNEAKLPERDSRIANLIYFAEIALGCDTFAGDEYCYGEAIYDSKIKCFTGTSYINDDDIPISIFL